MEEYLVLENAYVYGISLQKARRFTEEEKVNYADWFKERGFVSLGELVKLDEIMQCDLESIESIDLSKPDGEFNGSSNMSYIINKEAWEALITLNESKRKDRVQKEKQEKVNEYQKIIKACEVAPKLYTTEEAKQARINYNNLYNEGGEGYVPHFYTVDEYEWAKKNLAELEAQEI